MSSNALPTLPSSSPRARFARALVSPVPNERAADASRPSGRASWRVNHSDAPPTTTSTIAPSGSTNCHGNRMRVGSYTPIIEPSSLRTTMRPYDSAHVSDASSSRSRCDGGSVGGSTELSSRRPSTEYTEKLPRRRGSRRANADWKSCGVLADQRSTRNCNERACGSR